MMYGNDLGLEGPTRVASNVFRRSRRWTSPSRPIAWREAGSSASASARLLGRFHSYLKSAKVWLLGRVD